MWIVVGTASEFAIICNAICTILTNVLPYIINVDKRVTYIINVDKRVTVHNKR